MIDIGLTNALAQIRDALYEVADTIKEVKETEDAKREMEELNGQVDEVITLEITEDIVNKCENCPYKTYYEQGYV